MFQLYLCQLLPILALASILNHSPTTSSFSPSRKDLIAFLNDGFNKNVAPCDDFYDFVCGNHSSSSSDLLRNDFQENMLKLVRSDTKYPSVKKALLDYIADCVEFTQNNTYKLAAMQRYMQNVLNVTPHETPNYLESLLKVIFPAPELPTYGAFAPTKLLTSFYEDENRLSIWADPNHLFVHEDGFDETLDYPFILYRILTIHRNHSEYYILKSEESKILAFVTEFRSIVANSNLSLRVTKTLQNLSNKELQKAIQNTLPYYVDNEVNMAALKVSVDEKMIDKLQKLFLNQPREGKHFIMCVAISLIDFSIKITPNTLKSENVLISEAPRKCFDDALDPKKSGALFNLYAANLLVRNYEAMTTVNDQLTVRDMVEMIRFQIRHTLTHASWLQDDRQMLRNIDTLLNITKTVGLPEEVYNETRFSSELSHFTGFYKDDDMIQKILRLRSSNTRLVEAPRRLGTPESYFTVNAEYSVREKKLNLLHMILQPPFYGRDYPTSYNYGMLGSIIGHEFFHQFAPPHMPSDWSKNTYLNKTLNCYENFYGGLCYNLTKETASGEKKLEEVCADGRNDMKDNIPDVEGARVAFLAMKSLIGEFKLKERAMPELSFTNEQMFFVARAQFYCDKMMNDHEHFATSLKDTDSHGADRVRVNAISMQMEEFRSAFSCKSTDRMVIEKHRRCQLLPSK